MVLRPAPRWAVASLILAVVVMAGLVAIGARQLPGGEVRPPPFVLRVDPAEVVTWVFVVLVAVGGSVLLYLVLTAARRSGAPSRRRRTSPFVTMAALLVIAALIIFGPIDRIREMLAAIVPTDSEVVSPGGGAGPPLGTAGPTGSLWWVAVLIAVVALAALAVAALSRRGPTATVDRSAATDDIVGHAAEEALAAMRLGDDPRSAVLRAYAAMEQTLADTGWGRRPWEAPGEYLSRVSPRLGTGTAAGLTLTRVFEGARFGWRPVSTADRAAAEEALVELRTRVVQPS
jgi:hypothetical protein